MLLRKGKRVFSRGVKEEGGVKTFRGGELSWSCGYPVLKLRGSYYKMGLQYGVLMEREIRGLYGKNNGKKEEVMEALPWYLRPAGSFIMALVAGYSILRIPGRYRRELKGLSRGSGVPYMDMATTAFGGVVFDAACTSVLARGDGRMLHSQNLDFEPAYLGTFPVIVEYHHPGKLRYMHLGIAGVPGIFHGMNEKGISVTVNYGDGTYNSENKGLPMGYKLREILERAETIDEVESIIRETGPDELGWIVTAASAAEKTGAVFDIFNGEIVRSQFNGSGPEFVLNNIFSPERTGNTELSGKYLQISRGEGIYNLARSERIKTYMAEGRISTVDEMIDFLRDYDFYGYRKFCGSMNTTIVNERTLHTIIFDHSGPAVYLSSAEGYSSLSEIIRYDFNSGDVITYRDAAPEFSSPGLRGFMEWYSSYQDVAITGTVMEGISGRFRFIRFGKPDYSDVLKKADDDACRNPRELWSLFRLWKKRVGGVSGERLLNSCNCMTGNYPDFAILHIIKGNIENSLKQYTEAINSFEKALQCGIISGYDRIHIYNDLVRLCFKNGMKEKAVKYAELNIDLIDALTERFSIGRNTGKIYERMKKYLERPD